MSRMRSFSFCDTHSLLVKLHVSTEVSSGPARAAGLAIEIIKSINNSGDRKDNRPRFPLLIWIPRVQTCYAMCFLQEISSKNQKKKKKEIKKEKPNNYSLWGKQGHSAVSPFHMRASLPANIDKTLHKTQLEESACVLLSHY